MACATKVLLRTKPSTICSTFCTVPRSRTFQYSCRPCGPSRCGCCRRSDGRCAPRTSATALTLDSRRLSPVLIVRSPVRISFGGGGTDLPSYYETFGGAVVSAVINKYFYTILGHRSDGRVQVALFGL